MWKQTFGAHQQICAVDSRRSFGEAFLSLRPMTRQSARQSFLPFPMMAVQMPDALQKKVHRAKVGDQNIKVDI